MEKKEVFHIIPGFYCNLACSHCANLSSPKNKVRVSEKELSQLRVAIQECSPGKLLFTGGEPLLHIEIINEIISFHPNLEETEIQFTTNGLLLFEKEGFELLSKCMKLDSLQLSYDIYHGSKLSIENVKIIQRYCKEKKLNFNISSCVSNFSELLELKKVSEEIDAEITFQKVEASGRASLTEVAFSYPSFENEVLEKKCPALDQVSYICGKGFSTCCSNLIFNNDFKCFDDSLDDYLNSTFYKNLKNNNFRELANIYNVELSNLTSEFSSPCKFCEYIHLRAL